ncbi:celllulose biosynthesis operon protein BcsF/YhjT [Cronobacter sakazakii]|nr:celllulose biosynthesis operon protein BcsF/YhjT [Cronobacter sakazakii]
MMSISDILQLIALCALIFIPLGYALCVGKRRMMKTLRPLLFRHDLLNPLVRCAAALPSRQI